MEGENAGLRCTTFDDLPEECIVKILSFVTPVDACRSAFVSPFFRSAANSDALWETFLPSDYVSVLSNFAADRLSLSSKKELFRALCNPIIYDDGKKSVWVDKNSGNISYMLAARGLAIESADNPQNWRWREHNNSRFPEVAEFIFLPVLDIRGEISSCMMRPGVTYGAYLVYRFHANAFCCTMVDTSVGVAETETSPSTLCLTPDFARTHAHPDDPAYAHPDDPAYPDNLAFLGVRPAHAHPNNLTFLDVRRPKEREDGWMEIELGEYLNNGSGSELISIQVKGVETRGILIIEGIEIRPTVGQ